MTTMIAMAHAGISLSALAFFRSASSWMLDVSSWMLDVSSWMLDGALRHGAGGVHLRNVEALFIVAGEG